MTFILCHQCTKYKQEVQGQTLVISLDVLWFIYLFDLLQKAKVSRPPLRSLSQLPPPEGGHHQVVKH